MDFLNTNDTGVQDDLYRWFAYYKDSFLSFEEFGNQGDYAAYLDSLSFESIKSMLIKRKRGMNKAEKFKSEPEVLIANWLFENGIEYIYMNTHIRIRQVIQSVTPIFICQNMIFGLSIGG